MFEKHLNKLLIIALSEKEVKRMRIIKPGKAVILTGIFAIALLACFFCAYNPDILSASGEPKKVPIYCVNTDEKKIAVSFDAAWGDQFTDGILDILDRYNVKTTFFLVGFWVDQYPDKVKEISRRGHEIGNHSSTHPKMTGLSPDKMAYELNATSDKIEKLTGKRPVLFRPPFGDYNNTLIEVADANGYKTVQWSVDSLDWKKIGSGKIAERVVRNINKGSIVLFHNNSDYVLEYLPNIIKKLQSEGYQIVPVGELIYHENYYIDHTGKQFKVK